MLDVSSVIISILHYYQKSTSQPKKAQYAGLCHLAMSIITMYKSLKNSTLWTYMTERTLLNDFLSPFPCLKSCWPAPYISWQYHRVWTWAHTHTHIHTHPALAHSVSRRGVNPKNGPSVICCLVKDCEEHLVAVEDPFSIFCVWLLREVFLFSKWYAPH